MNRVHKWRRLDGRPIRRPIEEEVRMTILKELACGHQLQVSIGTDSQVKGGDTAFATVIVFLRKGKGGFLFISSETLRRPMTVKERMLEEVARSIEVAYALADVFARYGLPVEVHADINPDPKFRSNEALKEAMGYIMGMGFAFRAKPHAFASSSCANKIVQ
ncbi:ribonuclease H-like YkuK family protein [Flaviaesturariibacter amylovorans]